MKIITMLAMIYLYFNSIYVVNAQRNPNSALFMQQALIRVTDVYEKSKTSDIVRTETGFLLPEEKYYTAYSYRTLVGDVKYIFTAYSDDRVKDITLQLWKKNAESKWEKIKEVNDDKNDIKGEELGNIETMSIEPEKEGEYAIGILATKEGNRAGRYGLIVALTNKSSTSNTNKKSFFSTDTKNICLYDKNTKKFDKSCSNSDEVTLFELNSKETIFKHTTSTLTSSYFVEKKEYDEKNKLTQYTVKSDVGNTYTFLINDDRNHLFILSQNGDESYLTKWHFKKVWSE